MIKKIIMDGIEEGALNSLYGSVTSNPIQKLKRYKAAADRNELDEDVYLTPNGENKLLANYWVRNPEGNRDFNIARRNARPVEEFQEFINSLPILEGNRNNGPRVETPRRKFKNLYGEENYNKFETYTRLQLPSDISVNEWNDNDGQTNNMLDYDYWIGDEVKGWRARDPQELKEFFEILEENNFGLTQTENGRYVLTSSLNNNEGEAEEAEPEEIEEEVILAPLTDPEDITPAAKVEGPGIEYIGCNEFFRLYHITSVEGARKFALPRGKGMGWCVTGGGTWSSGPISNSNRNFLDKSKEYWDAEKAYDLYFFMTEPMGESWALALSIAKRYTNSTCWWRARTDIIDSQSLYGKLVPRTIPLNLLENELGSEKIRTFFGSANSNEIRSLPQAPVEFVCVGPKLTKCNIINTSTIIVPANTVEGGNTRLTTIGRKAFRLNTNLTTVKFTSNVTTLENGAFEDQTTLTTVGYLNHDGAITSIGKRAFLNCKNLKLVDFLNVTSIPEETFKGCSGLQMISLNSNLTTICEAAFEGCGQLTQVEIPASCTHIGINAFKNCGALTIKANCKKSEMPKSWYRQILTDANVIFLPEAEETEVTTDSVEIEDYDPYEWFEEHTIDQSMFVRLIKYDEKDTILTGKKYAIFNDLNLIKVVEADTDEEAKEAFEKWLKNGGTKVNGGLHDSKSINDEEMVVDTDKEEDEEELPTEEEMETKEVIAKAVAEPSLEEYTERIKKAQDPEHEYKTILKEIEKLNLDVDVQNELEDGLWDFMDEM